MFCSKCGATNADDAVFCASCGNSLKAPAPSSGGPSGGGVPEFSFGSIPSGPASFQMSKAISNAINLVKSPASFMRQNAGDSVPVNTTMIGYVAVLAAIPFIATLIGDAWYYDRLFGYIFGLAIAVYIFDLIGVFIMGFIIWKLAPNFATTTTQEKATLLAAFIYTPAFLLSIVDLLPFVSFIVFLGFLYGLYILYIGLPIMLSTPKDKALVYTIVAVVAAIIVYAVFAVITGAIAAALILH